ncbi:TPA: hypothetical protein QDC51_001433 [Burkholderia multivorans]|nr:hypothetical protein [Burkholderia multivorans]HDR9840792.1 hypothetical protein [Burkholderia multivorans]HDR9847314.1 hypothetical protein [Burkholderia multivorans]HDR9853727.1 hypothetical protein [Burkholderia multivorans]
MKITDDMLKKAREAAIAYANEHVRELAEEIIGWQDSAILLNGRLRDLAKMIEIFDAHHSLHVAESFAIRSVLNAAANRTTPDRDAIIEECAKVCDEMAEAYGRNDEDHMADAAVACGDEIRALKPTPTAASSSAATDDKNVYVSVRFKDAVVRRSITTAELDSFASQEVPARLFGSVVLAAINAVREGDAS